MNLNYLGESLAVTPRLLKYGDHNQALFALRGSSRAASFFSEEVLLKINGQTVNGNFSFRQVETSCDSDIHFVGANIPELPLGIDKRLEILVPSIRAMFDMHIWPHSVEP